MWLYQSRVSSVVNDDANVFRLIDSYFFIKRIIELIIYILNDQYKYT